MSRITSQTRKNKLGDSYFVLIQQFALKPIKNDTEHDTALKVVQDLMGRPLDSDEEGYLDTLLMLVNRYEEKRWPIDESMSPLEALRAIMSANDMKQADLAKIIGSQSAASMILSGERQLSKAHVRKLSERFKIDPLLFLG